MASRRTDSSGDGWVTYHSGMTDANYYMDTRQSNGQASASTVWNGTAPTNKVFSVGTSTGTNTSSKTYVALCWHSVPGYSRFSKWVGNGSVGANTFVYTGFKPAWIMWKATDAEPWYIWDNGRNPININQTVNLLLRPDYTNAEVNEAQGGVLPMSNGFKVIGDSGWHGTNAQRYIYCAFAEHPWICLLYTSDAADE